MKTPDIVVDMSRGDGGDSNQSCWGFVLPSFLFLGSHSAQWLTSSKGESKRRRIKKKEKEEKKATASKLFLQQCVRARSRKSTFYATHLILQLTWCYRHPDEAVCTPLFTLCLLDLQLNKRIQQTKLTTQLSCVRYKLRWKTMGRSKSEQTPTDEGLSRHFTFWYYGAICIWHCKMLNLELNA